MRPRRVASSQRSVDLNCEMFPHKVTQAASLFVSASWPESRAMSKNVGEGQDRHAFLLHPIRNYFRFNEGCSSS